MICCERREDFEPQSMKSQFPTPADFWDFRHPPSLVSFRADGHTFFSLNSIRFKLLYKKGFSQYFSTPVPLAPIFSLHASALLLCVQQQKRTQSPPAAPPPAEAPPPLHVCAFCLLQCRGFGDVRVETCSASASVSAPAPRAAFSPLIVLLSK